MSRHLVSKTSCHLLQRVILLARHVGQPYSKSCREVQHRICWPGSVADSVLNQSLWIKSNVLSSCHLQNIKCDCFCIVLNMTRVYISIGSVLADANPVKVTQVFLFDCSELFMIMFGPGENSNTFTARDGTQKDNCRRFDDSFGNSAPCVSQGQMLRSHLPNFVIYGTNMSGEMLFDKQTQIQADRIRNQ